MTDIATIKAPTRAEPHPLPNFQDVMNTFFGPGPEPVGPYVDDRGIGLRYKDETTLRKGLAAIALAHGWYVDEEVVIPGWGRIDLVLRSPGEATALLVELKLELTKPAKVRRAFQQADGYGRWWAANRGAADTLLVGVECETPLIDAASLMYPAVRHLSAGRFVGLLGESRNRTVRLRVAQRRRTGLLKTLALYDQAIKDLGGESERDTTDST